MPFAGLAAYLTYSRAGVFALAVALAAALTLSRHRWTVALSAAAVAAATGAAILVVRGHPELADATGGSGAGVALLVLLLGSGLCAAVAVGATRAGTDELRLRPQSARLAVAASALLVLAATLIAGRGPLDRAWDEFRSESAPVRSADPSARLGSFGGTRYEVWGSALDAFESDRSKGIGSGSFEFWWAREGDEPEFLRDGHSLYLETLAELGLPGLAAVLAVLAALLTAAMQARARMRQRSDFGAITAMIAIFIVFCFYAAVDWVWEVPAVVVLALGGIAVAGAAGFKRWAGRRVPPLALAAAVTGALVLAALQVPGLSSTERLRASAAALRSGDDVEALALADESVRAMPWAAGPYAQRALAREQLGEVAAAADDLREAIRNEPTNWRHHALLARVLARRGDAEHARHELRRARELSPHSPFLQPGSSFEAELQRLLESPG